MEEEYNKKLESLQQYIPFLNNMIAQLKDPRKKNREPQLAKMVSLHSMITDKKKKLKLDTLTKCEDVILKLYEKVKSGSNGPPPFPRITPSPASFLSPITPSSPSPPRDLLLTKPVVIPTEKVIEPSEWERNINEPSTSFKPKIDIYSSAADSLKTPTYQKPSVFERLGKRGPELSKPPISIEDLEALQQDVLNERMSLNELTDLREKLQKQLKTSDNGDKRGSPINTTVRNTTILTKKAVEKSVVSVDSKSKPDKLVAKTIVPNKPVKVVKEASSIFGSALSSIDNKLLEGKKEKERRNSGGKKEESEKKERRSSKDEKRDSSKSSKDKTEKKSSEHKNKDKEREKKDKDRKPKDDKKHETKKEHHDKERKKEDKPKEPVKNDESKKEEPAKIEDKLTEQPKPTEPPPVYKRLADKYNPKPRKPSTETCTPKKADNTEIVIKTPPPTLTSIPLLDLNQKSPTKTLPQIPLLSPTSSTVSLDNEVASFNRIKPPLLPLPQQIPPPRSSTPTPNLIPPLLSLPQQVPPPRSSTPIPNLIPSHVSNMLANPNTSALINTVVNQFKGRPLIPPTPNAYSAPSPQNFQNNNFEQRGNFWGNQQQIPHQNFPPRSFTPIPNQFDNQMEWTPNQNQFNQPQPFNQQGSSFNNNQTQPFNNQAQPFNNQAQPFNNQAQPFNQQIPPLISPQFDNFERQRKDDSFKKDVDLRYRDDWRRQPVNAPPTQRPRDNYRDSNRDPRLQRDRDPRSHRDDQRSNREDPRIQRRDSRDHDRDNRGKFRDPRLNRNRHERERDRDTSSSRERDSSSSSTREREREPVNRQRARSMSRDSEESNNTFVSPLDSLYSGNDGYRKTGKGYGVQNFKIPKIKKEEVESEAEGEKQEVKESKEMKETKVEGKKDEVKVVEETTVIEDEKKDDVKKEEAKPKEPKAKEPEPKVTEDVTESIDENVASTSVSSSTECTTNESQKETSKESAEVSEISSTNDIPESHTREEVPKPLDDESQTDIINRFLKKLLENERTRAAASLFIDNVSNSLDDEKLKMVVQTVKSAAVEEPEKKPLLKRKKRLIRPKLNANLVKKRVMKKRLTMRKQKRKPVRVIAEDDDEDDTKDDDDEETKDEDDEETKDEDDEEAKEEKKEEEEEVVVSVGERIKSRKRVAAAPKRKKYRHKTELDLLHEDIQDMFIRDGVLTATGKRMCRLLKNDDKPPPTPEPRRRTRNSAEKFDSKANSEKLKAMSNVRVVLPKLSVEMDDESGRYSLRRSKAAKSYVEVDSEDEKEKEREKTREKEREEAERKKEEEKKVKEKEKKDDEESEAEKTPKKPKKRGQAWASGILPKRKKKTPEEKEDADKSFDLVEPDKGYFTDRQWLAKVACKLCDFDGVNIAKHYRITHPDSEVLSSRLSPKKAAEAIKSSTELNLDDKSDRVVQSTKHFPFTCRFCDLDMQTRTSNFYDHVSTHTGEYRHCCTLCDFCASNNKPLRTHYRKKHAKELYAKAAWIKTRVYGYICLECNFVQVKRKTVENHVNVYHLGDGKKIMKVHLSMLDDDAERKEAEEKVEPAAKVVKKVVEKVKVVEKEVEKVKVVEKEVEKVVEKEIEKAPVVEEEEEPKPKRKKPSERTQKRVSERPGVVPPALPKPPVKKEKEIDMRVFTCNTNMQEENEKIEQERLQKMTELAESVKSNRQSLNFVDQLSNRLLEQEQNEATTTPPPDVVAIKDEPLDDDAMEIEPEVEVPPVEPIIEPTVSPKKPTRIIESMSSAPVVQKDNSIIQGMIQKLQGILKEEKNDGPPPLAPLLEKMEDKAFLSAGFLNISKSPNGLEYACRVPSCLFTSTNRDSFVLHWKEDHTRINQSHKATKCRICQKEVIATQAASLLINFFAHVENEHLCGIKTSFNAGLISIDKDRDGFEYLCRVVLCTFITKNRENFISHLSEHSTLNETCKVTKCGICQSSISASAEINMLTNLFTHIESEHIVEEHKSPRVNILRTRRLSGDKLSVPKDESPETKDEEDNPFPFKISGVMSLAEETVPPLSPIKEKQSPKVESVILKEAKMNSIEKQTIWKCAEAMKKFLQCPRELYKCPQFFCKYATSWRHLFEGHIKAHARVNDELVSCVYCDVKTPLSHAGLHIELRHANCLYSCSQCLYRSLTREYVMIHNRLKHRESDLIIALPPKTVKTVVMSKQKRFAVKEVCQPYRCGSEGCNAQFLFLNEFCKHLEVLHNGIMSCGFLNNQQKCNFQCLVIDNMIDHWRTHSCYNYHCLLCKVGCMEVYTMLEHYSIVHPAMEPMVVDRRNSPSNSTCVYGYSEDAALKVRFIKEELLESVNVQQLTIIPAEAKEVKPESAAKNLTFVPLSIFNEKKVITIIPNNSADKPVQVFNPKASSTPFIFASAEDITKEKEDEVKAVEESDTTADNSADPLCLDSELSSVLASGDESDSQEINDPGELKNFGLIGYQLYRCAFCDISFSNARDFKAHSMHSKQCKETGNTARQFKCVHCHRMFKNPHGLLEHVQYHGQLRFGCSLCVKKFPSSFSLKLHMRTKHSVTNTITTPLIPNKTNLERDEFVLRPVARLDAENKDGPSTSALPRYKSVYGPEEVDQLPKRYIFNSNVKCALCPYNTKVRTNLVRHLQFHSSEKSAPDTAPVNPVPCLDKNERMFDKMTNLAISSMSVGSRMGGAKPETTKVVEEETQVPAYVPSHRRYVCCADGCNYLCLEESNLRHHLHALHIQEPSFRCVHCKVALKADVEGFLKHLKLHDLHLYKCSACSFVHNLRHKVGKHANDRHTDKIANTITIRALEAEIVGSEQSAASVGVVNVPMETPPAPNIKWTKPWRCGMCKYRCAAKSDILAHIFNKHNINAQFKCTLCSYKTDEKHTFEGHFKENHPDNDNDIDIIHVYYKSEGAGQSVATNQKQFDTTPLWQRDRPRVRHIRGILFEDSGTAPKMKKMIARSVTPALISTAPATISTPPATISTAPATITSASENLTNLEIAINAVATGNDYMTKKDTPIKQETSPVKKSIASTSAIDDSVIVIEDDDEVSAPRLDESGDQDLMIDMEGGVEGGDSTQIKEEQEREFLSEEILCNKYGKLCAPVARMYKCPLCPKYRNKRVSTFVHHILTEMRCNRFKCKSCDFVSVTFDTMVSHCQEKHDSILAANVADTPIDKRLEYWLQILLKYQSKAMVQIGGGPSADNSSLAKITCEYCDKTFKNVHLLKEHELYHWADHVYKCDHCFNEFDSLNELFQHTFMTHPSFDVAFTTNGPYIGKLIAILKTPQNTAQPQHAPFVEDTQYSCNYCAEVTNNLELLRKHASEFHEGEEFVYKVVSKTKVDPLYCCAYCHERGSETFLKTHHEEKHEGQKFNIYQYICLECSKIFLNIKDLRGHFLKSHSGKKLTYSCIENKWGGSKDQYCCTKCPFRSCSVGGIRNHLRKHLRPLDCLTCGATFVFPTEGRTHHSKEHLHSVERIEENKEKLKEYEDLVQQIVAAKDRGEASTSATAPPPRKMLARKSTGAPFIREYSFYGNKKEDTDLKNVSTSIEVNTVKTKISAEQFSNIFNIFPVVEVKDCENREEVDS